ncbi:DEAD/DEAH box helicase [Nocardioides marmoriginsengisoli]|uniref:DEAD/DEAH box helicase n=1 Tax=Nocardioides marmoriginsengisoli TaxID=661483 RepID=A0A3N0CSM6_9ACTN|nr:DEAD/DEAH box helicase [Nocardioides marmoriginsengisoli]RNL66271.1 DEAD/DEAH box helicase [Nocardioides marmoriginsengisoli]
MTSNGTLTYEDASWALDVAPHIAIRVKRLFPRAYQGRTATIRLTDTPDVARDLEMLLMRHPLTIDTAAQARLQKRADEHRATEEQIAAIITGTRTITGLRDPAVPPRDYQVTGADLALTTRGLLISDDVGLGKTFTSLLTLRDPANLPALVVTLTHLPRQWLRELNKFMPWLTGHIITKGQPYPVDADVLITNYHKLGGWRYHLQGNINTIIFDEIQELRRDNTVKYSAAAAIADKAGLRIGLSATPIYNYGGETHTIFDVLNRGALGTRSEFVREWNGHEQSGGNIHVENMGALGAYLRDQGLLLRRTRKDVHRELPDPIEIEHEVSADAAAIDQVRGDITEMARLILDTSTAQKDRWSLAGQLDWKVRQATGIAKAPFVAEFVRLLLESDEKVSLWGWHRDVYEIWMDALAEFDPVLYTGSESPNQKDKAADAFINGTSRIFIGSLRSGAGLDGLQTVCSNVVFGELDWSPAIHHQVIGRFNRDGQDSTVVAYYLTTDSGSDPVVADVLEIKKQQAAPLIDPQAALFTAARSDTNHVQRLAQALLDANTTTKETP